MAKGDQKFIFLTAGFLAGSFAGAAFGVFFALSLNQSQFPPPAPLPSAGTAVAVSEDARVIGAVKKVSPSVVSIAVLKDVSQIYNQANPFFSFNEFFGIAPPAPALPKPGGAPPPKQQVGGGSGFIISSGGLVLTNKHVVLDDGAEYQVNLQDGRSFKATMLAKDVILDLAVLKIDAKDLPVVDLGDSDKLQIGQTVIAIGNVLAEYQNTVTKGVVSGINRRVVASEGGNYSEVIDEAIQTDAAINPGNSGGPLVDLQGKVVGVNTAINQAGQSIGFAIPIDAAKVVIDSVRKTGKIERPWLGVRYALVTKDLAQANGLGVDYGALVVRGSGANEPAVVSGSPADKAGIVEHDILLEIEGVRIDADHSLSIAVSRKRAGDVVRLKVLHQGKERTVDVILGQLPDSIK